MPNNTVLIVGAGAGLSASLARKFAAEDFKVALAARDTGKLAGLASETGARTYSCDVESPEQVAALFNAVNADLGDPAVIVYNPSFRVRGPFVEIDAEKVRTALMVSCYGGFLVGQEAAKRMLQAGSGSILFTGASASVKGYVHSASFAMGKFGLRGLAQSMARELSPKNIHVAHFIIDGGIRGPGKTKQDDPDDKMLCPDAIADTYWHIHSQDRSAWTWEVELRPFGENF
jgi:NAD(P)-dependent dehydrogenase (short-subunit alcohol dehydrogenase family)